MSPKTIKLSSGVRIEFIGANEGMGSARVFVSDERGFSGADLSTHADWVRRGILPLMDEIERLRADALESTEPVADSRGGLRLHDLASPFDEIADSVAILKEYLEDYEQSAFAQTIAQLRGNRETWFTIKYLRDSNSKVCGFMMFDASGEASVRASLGMEAK